MARITDGWRLGILRRLGWNADMNLINRGNSSWCSQFTAAGSIEHRTMGDQPKPISQMSFLDISRVVTICTDSSHGFTRSALNVAKR
jgi:hypothetical protein